MRRLELAPDATELARRLSDRSGAVLARAGGGTVTYLACDPIEVVGGHDPEPTLLRRPCALGETPRWFGTLPYDSLRALEGEPFADARPQALLSTPCWLRYDAVLRVAEHVDLIAESEAAARRLEALLARPAQSGPVRLVLRGSDAADAHAARVRRALEEIELGNVYEVNLARRFELEASGGAVDLLAAFERSGAMPHAFALDFEGTQVVAVTPELCLRLEADGSVLTSPIKGTRPRHSERAEDLRLARELDEDPKERAELTMIIDVERNDLGRVAEAGSVELCEPPHVVALPGIHHRVASVKARVAPDLGRGELMTAMLPSGSVTGAPKRRAMQLIAELEPHRRGLYTGALGYVRHDGGLELKMAIRTLCVRDGVGHYFAGGGIVADSIPEREVEETLWKAERLVSLLG